MHNNYSRRNSQNRGDKHQEFRTQPSNYLKATASSVAKANRGHNYSAFDERSNNLSVKVSTSSSSTSTRNKENNNSNIKYNNNNNNNNNNYRSSLLSQSNDVRDKWEKYNKVVPVSSNGGSKFAETRFGMLVSAVGNTISSMLPKGEEYNLDEKIVEMMDDFISGATGNLPLARDKNQYRRFWLALEEFDEFNRKAGSNNPSFVRNVDVLTNLSRQFIFNERIEYDELVFSCNVLFKLLMYVPYLANVVNILDFLKEITQELEERFSEVNIIRTMRENQLSSIDSLRHFEINLDELLENGSSEIYQFFEEAEKLGQLSSNFFLYIGLFSTIIEIEVSKRESFLYPISSFVEQFYKKVFESNRLVTTFRMSFPSCIALLVRYQKIFDYYDTAAVKEKFPSSIVSKIQKYPDFNKFRCEMVLLTRLVKSPSMCHVVDKEYIFERLPSEFINYMKQDNVESVDKYVHDLSDLHAFLCKYFIKYPLFSNNYLEIISLKVIELLKVWEKSKYFTSFLRCLEKSSFFSKDIFLRKFYKTYKTLKFSSINESLSVFDVTDILLMLPSASQLNLEEDDFKKCVVDLVSAFINARTNYLLNKNSCTTSKNLSVLSEFSLLVDRMYDYRPMILNNGSVTDDALSFYTLALKSVGDFKNSYFNNDFLRVESLLVILSSILSSDKITYDESIPCIKMAKAEEFSKSFEKLRFLFRNQLKSIEFLNRLVSMESSFASHADLSLVQKIYGDSIPRAYGTVCKIISNSIIKTVLSGYQQFNDKGNTVIVLAEFLHRELLSSCYDNDNRNPSFSVLTLFILQDGIKFISDYVKDSPFKLFKSMNFIVTLKDRIDEIEGRKDSHAMMLKSLLCNISKDICIIESYMELSIQSFVNSLGDDPELSEIRKKDIILLKNSFEVTFSVWRRFGFMENKYWVSFDDVYEAEKNIDGALNEMKELQNVDKWLRGKGFVATGKKSLASLDEKPEDLNLSLICGRKADIEDAWKFDDLKENKKMFSILKFLIGNNSERNSHLFDSNFNESLSKYKTEIPHLDAWKISEIVNDTVLSLENIIRDNNQTLQDIAMGDVRAMKKILHGGQDDFIFRELSIISEFFRSMAGQDEGNLNNRRTLKKEELQEKMKLVEAATKIIELSNILPLCVNFLNSNAHLLLELGTKDLNLNDFNIISASIQDKASIRLADATKILDKIEIILCGLNKNHLKLLSVLADAHELIQFIRTEPDIRNNIENLSQEMQENSHNEEVLGDLSITHNLFESHFRPLISSKTSPFKSFLLFCSSLNETSSNACLQYTKSLQTCIAKRSDLTVWFARAGAESDKVIFNIKEFNEKKYYFVAKSSTASEEKKGCLSLRSDIPNSSSFSGVRLIEQVQAAVFVFEGEASSRLLTESVVQNLKNFIDSHDIAQQVLSTLQEAESVGIPEYQNFELQIGNSIHLPSIKSCLENLRDECKDFNNEIAFYFVECHRFGFINRTQLQNVFKAIQSRDLYSLMPYIVLCFPDVDFVKGILKSKIDAKLNDILSKTEKKPLCQLLEVIQYFEEKFKCFRDLEPSNTRPKLLNACLFSNSKLMRYIEYFVGCKIPLSSQLLYCSNKLTKMEINRFLKLINEFPDVCFVIIGVNCLDTDCGRVLFQALSDSSFSNIGSNLLLVFTDKRNIDIFSHLLENDDDADNDFGGDNLSTKNIFKSLNVFSTYPFLSVVTGKAGAGKSFYIDGEIKKRSLLKRTLSCHEDFSVKEFSSWYHDKSEKNKFGLHINISEFGLQQRIPILQRISNFLYFFLSYGLIVDDINQEVTQVKINCEHYIYIELPPLAGERDDDKSICHPYVETISVLSPLVDEWKCISYLPLVIDGDSRLVAHYLKLYYANEFQNKDIVKFGAPLPLEIIQNQDSKDSECSAILEKKFFPEFYSASGNSVLEKITCIRMLANRFKFIWNAQQQIYLDTKKRAEERYVHQLLQCEEKSKKNYFHDLIKIFINESTLLSSNQSLEDDWSKVNACLTSRYFNPNSAYDMTINFICPMAANEYEAKKMSMNSSASLHGAYFVDNLDNKTTATQLIRNVFAPAFGVESSKLISIFSSQGYVLTLDLAIKMLVLFERKSAKVSTILEGETGTGKTELVAMLNLILNKDSRINPDLLFELKTGIQKCVDLKFLASENHPALFGKNSKLHDSENMVKLLPALVNILDKDNDALLNKIAPVLIQHFRRVLREFPSLERSDLVKSVLCRDLKFRRKQKNEKIIIEYDSEDEDEEVSKLIAESTIENVELKEKPIHESRILSDFLTEIVSSVPKHLFHNIRMHGSISTFEFRRLVKDIVKSTLEWNEITTRMKREPVDVTVFIDELNTTSIMGMVKEVVSDHTLDGNPLPENIFWLAAINPHEQKVSNGSESKYVVNTLPESMSPLVYKFGKLNENQEKAWTDAYFSESSIGLSLSLDTKDQRIIMEALKSGIINSQSFIREKKTNQRSEVSIRDICRAIHFFKFFTNSTNKEIFLPSYATEFEKSWIAVNLSLALVYYFRLEKSKDFDFRSEYKNFITKIFESGDNKCIANLSKNFAFGDTLQKTIDNLWKATKRERGIASTEGLKENLFAIVVCSEACVPLVILGPPGTGKTLSFQIASSNMKGKSSSSKLYQKLKVLQTFVYQCSNSSTASEIQDIFELALDRRDRYVRANIDNENRCVVFLDEAGLPKEKRAALKSIHYYTDHAKVGSILLTNNMLDAAKSNRAVNLFQTETSSSDLKQLARGSLLGDVHFNLHEIGQTQINGLCEAYKNAYKYCDILGHSDAFHLRDFIYLCRFIRHCNDLNGWVNESYQLFSQDILIKSLRRTFNGISKNNFVGLATMFLEKTFPNKPIETVSLNPNVLSSLREALNDKLSANENLNQSHFRHTMLIDSSSNENGINLLMQSQVLDPKTTEVFQCSDFPSDNTELARSALISRIKSAVEAGKVIVLVNCQTIFTSFYDLFNKHYSLRLTKKSKTDGLVNDIANDEINVRYSANISIGSFSRPCDVHEITKIIVHVPVSQLALIPLALLNRFDKYSISVVDLLSERLAQLEEREKFERIKKPSDELFLSQIFSHIKEGVDHFADALNGPSTFYGFVEKETVAILILRSINDTINSNSSVPVIRKTFHIDHANVSGIIDQILHENINDDDEIENNPFEIENKKVATLIYKRLREFIRAFNFQLLQFARPEYMFFLKNVLPKAYIQEYLQQEHFSARNYIKFLVDKHFERPLSSDPLLPHDPRGNKQILFVRTSAEIYHLSFNVESLRKLLPSTHASDNFLPRVLKLEAYSSSNDFKIELRNFLRPQESHKRVLLISADCSIVVSSQVNFAIRIIDMMLSLYESKENQPLVLFLLHYPSKSSSFKAVFDSLPSNDWDMSYIDSFGTSSCIENNIDKSDSRRWMRVAYGIDKELSPEEGVVEFKEPLYSELQNLLGSTSINLIQEKKLRERGIEKSMELYTSKSTKVASTISIFIDRPYIVDSFLRKFTSLWVLELPRTIHQASEEIIKGSSLESLLDRIRNSFSSLLKGFGIHFIRMLCMNFGLEAIASLPCSNGDINADNDEIKSFLYLVEGIKLPIAEQLKKQSQSLLLALSLNSLRREAPRTPLLSEYELQIQRLKSQTVNSSFKEESNESINNKMSNCLQSDFKNLYKSVRIIENNEALMENIIHDSLFCIHGLEYTNKYEKRLVLELIKLDVERENQKQNGLIVASLLNKFDMRYHNNAIAVLRITKPLRHLIVDEEEMIVDFYEIFTQTNINNSNVPIRKIVSILEDQVVDLMWRYGYEILSNEAETLESMKQKLIKWNSSLIEISNRPRNDIISFCKVAFFNWFRNALSIGCNLKDIQRISIDMFNKIDNSLNGTEDDLLLTFESLLSSSSLVGSNASMISTLIEEMVNFFCGSFEEVDNGVAEYVIKSLGYDVIEDCDGQVNVFQNVPILVQIKWLVNLVSPSSSMIPLVNQQLHERSIVSKIKLVEPFLHYSIRKGIDIICDDKEHLFAEYSTEDDSNCLHSLVYQAELEILRQDPNQNFESLCADFEELSNFYTPENKVLGLKISALCVHIIEVGAFNWIQGHQMMVNGSIEAIHSYASKWIGYYFIIILKSSESVMVKFLSEQINLKRFFLPADYQVPLAVKGEVKKMVLDDLFGMMPFIVDEKDENNFSYTELVNIITGESDVSKLDEWVDNMLTHDKLYYARMMLFLAPFHVCFLNGNPSLLISEFMDNIPNLEKLKITHHEKLVYKIICNGPIRIKIGENEDESIIDYLTYDSLNEDIKSMRRLCLINVMAMILGSPKDKSYYYQVIFEQRFMTSLGLGSGHSNLSKDCGYQVTNNNFYDVTTPPPFLGIRRYRAINNYFVWISFAWSNLIYTDELFPDQSRYLSQACTYHRERFGGDTKGVDVLNRLSESSRRAIYFFARANAFLMILETDEVLHSNAISPILMLSVVSFNTMKALQVSPDDVPSSFFPRSQANSVESLKKTSDYLIDQIWEPSFSLVKKIQKNYDSAYASVGVFGRIKEAAEVIYFKNCKFIFPSFISVEQALALESTALNGKITDFATYAYYFLSKVSFLEMGKNVSFLVKVYKWLHEKLAFRLSIDETNSITAWDSIQRLDDSDKELGRVYLKELQTVWNENREVFQTYITCNFAGDIEAEIIHLDVEKISIGAMLSNGSKDVVDLISRLLDGRFILEQNNHLNHDSLTKLLSSKVNNFCSICTESGDLDLAFLPEESEMASILRVDDIYELQDFLRCHSKIVPTLNEGQCTFSTQVNAEAISRFLISKYISGKPRLNKVKLQEIHFSPKRDDDCDESGKDENDPNSNLLHATTHLITSLWASYTKSEIYKKENYKDDIELFYEECLSLRNIERHPLDLKLKNCNESTAKVIFSYLGNILDSAIIVCESNLEDIWNKCIVGQRIVQLKCGIDFKKLDNNVSSLLNHIEGLRISTLPRLVRRIISWHVEQEFLFPTIEDGFSKSLNSFVSSELSSILHSVLQQAKESNNKTFIVSSHEIFKRYTDIFFNDDLMRNIIGTEPFYPLHKIFKDSFKSILPNNEGEISQRLQNIILSDNVVSGNYVDLCKFFRKGTGALNLALSTFSSRIYEIKISADKNKILNDGGYIEALPDRYKLLQDIQKHARDYINVNAEKEEEDEDTEDPNIYNEEGEYITIPEEVSINDVFFESSSSSIDEEGEVSIFEENELVLTESVKVVDVEKVKAEHVVVENSNQSKDVESPKDLEFESKEDSSKVAKVLKISTFAKEMKLEESDVVFFISQGLITTKGKTIKKIAANQKDKIKEILIPLEHGEKNISSSFHRTFLWDGKVYTLNEKSKGQKEKLTLSDVSSELKISVSDLLYLHSREILKGLFYPIEKDEPLSCSQKNVAAIKSLIESNLISAKILGDYFIEYDIDPSEVSDYTSGSLINYDGEMRMLSSDFQEVRDKCEEEEEEEKEVEEEEEDGGEE